MGRDSFSGLERGFVQPYRQGFAWVTGPLVRLLAWLHVSPDLISASQMLIGGVIVVILGDHPRLGFSLMIFALFLDSLDGALARAYGRSSEFGALADQLSDHTRETLVIAALALHAGLHVVAAVLYPLIYAMFNFLLLLCNQRGAPVPWALKSYLTVYPAFFLWAFWRIDVLTPAVVAEVLLMTASILMALRNLRRVMS